MRAFVTIYSILFFLVLKFHQKMLNELSIEKYTNKIFIEKADEIKENLYDYKKIISLEKDTFPLIALSFSVGIFLLKELIALLYGGFSTTVADEVTYLIAYSIYIYIICVVSPNYVYISFCSTKIRDFLDANCQAKCNPFEK